MRFGRVASPSMLDALEVVYKDRGLRGDAQLRNDPLGGVATTLLHSELSPLEDGSTGPEGKIGEGWERREGVEEAEDRVD
jgi:hypothetical protein